jgi:hypothetical protein
MLLTDVLIVPNLVTPPLYKAFLVQDGGCAVGFDHAADQCPQCSKSRDTGPLLGLTLCIRRWL